MVDPHRVEMRTVRRVPLEEAPTKVFAAQAEPMDSETVLMEEEGKV